MHVEVVDHSQAEGDLFRLHIEDLFVEAHYDDELLHLPHHPELLVQQTLEIGRVDLCDQLRLPSTIDVVARVAVHQVENLSLAQGLQGLALVKGWQNVLLLQVVQV